MQEYINKIKGINKFGTKVWREIEEDRQRKSQPVQLAGKNKEPFWFVQHPVILGLISEIERNRGFLSSLVLPKKFLAKLQAENQKKEAYYSSHIEGAVTSLEDALLHLNKPSRKDYGDESLQMIMNNRDALDYLRTQASYPFSHDMICRLHKILVANTHKENPITVGDYRHGPIYVVNGQGQVVYEGPPASDVRLMMEAYVQWLNEEDELHPLIKAALVHLYFVHVHPFDDGNGRSARALSNLYLMKKDYQFINFLSPSDYFDHHRGDYYKAIQDTESHDRDATFFIIYYLKALVDQLGFVQSEIVKERKAKNIHDALNEKTREQLNKHQIKALSWMLESNRPLTTKIYCKLGRCSDETARKDFNRMIELGIIKKRGQGRTTGYLLNKMALQEKK